MTKRKVNTVHFRVEGKFIVETFRDIAVWESWKNALNGLTESFSGMTIDIAIGLLRGDYTLSGWDSDIALEEEKPEVKKELSDNYATSYGDVLLSDGSYWKPKYILNPSKMAYEFANDEFHGSTLQYGINASDLEIAMFWFEDANKYHITSHTTKERGNKYLVLWERSGKMPPFWLSDEKDPDLIIENLRISNRLSSLIVLDEEDGRDRLVGRYESNYDNVGLNITATESLEKAAKREAQTARERAFEISILRKKIWEQNGDDDFVILNDFYKVPRKPLAKWALSRSKARHLAKWDNISGTGWKMYGDDPSHTDWVIGAGIDPATIYDENEKLNEAAYSWRSEFLSKMTNQDLDVLVSVRNSICKAEAQHVNTHDKVMSDIVIIPDCSTKWINIAKQVGKRGGVIIAETGGKLSHLVMNGDDYGITLAVMPNALTIIPDGKSIIVEPSEGKLKFPDRTPQEIMSEAIIRSGGNLL